MTNKRKFNTDIIHRMAEEFEVSTNFIRKALNGHRTSQTAENIKKRYRELDMEIKKVLDRGVVLTAKKINR